MAKSKNTLDSGTIRYLLFQDGKEWTGVAIEFNIVIVGDDPEKIFDELVATAREFLTIAREQKSPPRVLNQADPKYEKMWEKEHAKHARIQPSPLKLTVSTPRRPVLSKSISRTSSGRIHAGEFPVFAHS